MPYIALKGFNNGAEYQKRGGPWTGTVERAKELLRAGLIAESTTEGTKAAPVPQNKMASEPENKGGGDPPMTNEGAGLVDQNAADVLAALPAITDPAVLAQALEAERAKGEKARKTVVDALETANAKLVQG